MKTLFYVGMSCPHKDDLIRLQSLGYKLGLLHDPLRPLKHKDIFDYIIDLDFSSEQNFRADISKINNLPQIDGLLCSYEKYIVYKAIAAEILSLPSLSINAARACTDKYSMRTQFLAHNPGITPEFTFVDSQKQLLNFAETVGYPLMLKPTNFVKSLLVSKCSSKEELLEAYEKTLTQIDDTYKKFNVTDREPRLILERFVKGHLCSVAAFIDEQGTPHFCEGIAELVAAQEIGFDDNFLYARKLQNNFDPDLKRRILEVARDGVIALSMHSSPAHIEIIYNDSEIKIVEIGARIGGYRPFLYGQSYGIDLIEQEAKIAVGEKPNLDGTFKKYSALYELFPSTISKFVKLDNIKSSDDYTYLHEVAKPGDVVGPAKDGYKSLAIIGASASDYASFTSQCQDIENIQVITT